MTRKLISEISFVLLASLALCLSLALFSFDTRDPGFAYVGHDITVRNWLGPAGAMIASFMFTVIGWMAYTIPLLILQLAIKLLRSRLQQNIQVPMLLLQTLAYVLLFLAACGVLSLHFDSQLAVSAGGGMGLWVNERLFPVLAMVGTTAVELTVLMITLTLIYRISWVAVIDVTGEAVLRAVSWAGAQQMPAPRIGPWRQRLSHWWQQKRRVKPPRQDPALDPLMSGDPLLSASPEHSLVQPAPPARAPEQAAEQAPADATPPSQVTAHQAPSGQPKQLRIEPLRSEPMFTTDEADSDRQEYGSNMQLPALELLHQPVQPKDAGYSEAALEEMGELLIARLKEFGVSAEMDAICPGPVITRFEIRPAPGTKASKISNLAKDLARSMAMVAVRVVEVIPGKSTVGIEVPNANRATVGLRGVLASNAFQHAASSVAMGIGHDIAGQPVVADLAKMPHLLVAGTTGSGKSVGVNSMLVSMLYKSTPDQLKLILIDPKMLELSVYEGIPHLLTPVVTDMNDAAQALRWCVGEMERRYQLMSKVGVRNLAGFNSKVNNANAAGEPMPDPLFDPSTALDPHNVPTLETLPQIVVVIDEFADMMMIVGKKCEELIARIAQKARAAGIHLILATQRPSVDVITGLIKANIPTRMAFQVSSKIDSRTILDQGGAEQLLGHGDMLYMPPGTSMPIRVHGAFVSDEDVHHVVDAWKAQGEAQYLDEILQEDALPEGSMLTGLTDSNASNSESDPLFDEAVFVVTKHRKASISFVQRQLRVGYNRAARLVETMEAAGVVSAAEHNGSRSVLAPPPAEV